AMSEMSAESQAHAQELISWLEHCHVYRHVSLRARMWLHVGVVGPENLFGAGNGKALGYVHVFAPAVVTLAWVTLRVLIGKHRTLGFQHRAADVVFRGD